MKTIFFIGVLFLQMFAAKKYLVEVGKDVNNSEEKEGQDYSGGFLFCMVIIFTKIIYLLQIISYSDPGGSYSLQTAVQKNGMYLEGSKNSFHKPLECLSLELQLHGWKMCQKAYERKTAFWISERDEQESTACLKVFVNLKVGRNIF